MAPTYKDLAKTWLSNWLPRVCSRLRKSVPLHVRACAWPRVHKRESWATARWKGAQTVSRSLHARCCYTLHRANAESGNWCRSGPVKGGRFSRRTLIFELTVNAFESVSRVRLPAISNARLHILCQHILI